MSIWMNFIAEGFKFYAEISIYAVIACVVVALVTTGKFNPVRFLADQAMVLYLCCLGMLVLSPMPGAGAEAAGLRYQFIPFYWVFDVLTKPSVHAFSGMLLNILMTIPFGMYLRYVYRMSSRKVILYALALTLCIEFLQLTGVFGTFQVSYRLCDVDDMITNTLGGYLGYLLVRRVEDLVPALVDFEGKKTVWSLMN